MIFKNMRRNYEDPEYKKWRQEVYKRDKFKCQWPGCNCKKRLNAHHIMRWADHPNLRFNPLNGLTLCSTHHKLIQGMESYYQAVFFNIAKRNSNE